jgi:putative 2-oxoglutarate-Fe(II)-dependent oxygenase superfamily protein
MIEKAIKSELRWATPILTVEHSHAHHLNRRLAEIILEKESQITASGKPTEIAGVKDGLTAHWLEYNVLNWDDPAITEFRQMVLSGLQEFFRLIGDPDEPGLKISGISCWANVLRYGKAIEVHHHDPGFVSGHYMVQSGRDPNQEGETAQPESVGGETVYYRPGFMDRSHGGESAALSSFWDSDWRISSEPEEGRLVFFPSYVRHEVRPNLGRRERISIAMDIYVEKQNALIYFGNPRWFVLK